MNCRAGALARDLPETTPHATSRRPTTQPVTAPLTWAVVWSSEVLTGGVDPSASMVRMGSAGSVHLELSADQAGKKAWTASDFPCWRCAGGCWRASSRGVAGRAGNGRRRRARLDLVEAREPEVDLDWVGIVVDHRGRSRGGLRQGR
jgi:hypothetical protein